MSLIFSENNMLASRVMHEVPKFVKEVEKYKEKGTVSGNLALYMYPDKTFETVYDLFPWMSNGEAWNVVYYDFSSKRFNTVDDEKEVIDRNMIIDSFRSMKSEFGAMIGKNKRLGIYKDMFERYGKVDVNGFDIDLTTGWVFYPNEVNTSDRLVTILERTFYGYPINYDFYINSRVKPYERIDSKVLLEDSEQHHFIAFTDTFPNKKRRIGVWVSDAEYEELPQKRFILEPIVLK